ncbi:MAG: LacI family DNA-binding transcriptional regulator [Rhodobacterales bacterium]|nr:LacI family DNA-binding transcriptional regulator [Rhodobacterales bacterium]
MAAQLDPPGATSTAKPTLKTISLLSGLAVPTVSRALSDAPDIGAQTKKLVRRIADEIGYVPNRAGVRLRTGRTNVLSLILSTEHDVMNHTARLISSIAGALQGTPYHLNVTPYFPTDDPMKPIRYVVETGSADAVIFNQIQPDDPRVAYLMERGFPFATHGRSRWADRHAYFDFDNTVFAELAVRRLVAAGRRQIIVVAPPLDQNYAQNILAGVTNAADACGIATPVIMHHITSDSASADVEAAVGRHLAAAPETDGIICASTSATMACVGALEGAGRGLGRDIDIFAKEAIPFLNLFRREIMAIKEDVKQAGEFLARAAIQAIREPGLPPLQGLDVPQDNG